jgi:transcription factor IIIB subunit 2
LDDSEFTSLQIEIDAALERDLKKNRKRKLNVPGTSLQPEDYDESTETDKFIGESTIDVINEYIHDGKGKAPSSSSCSKEDVVIKTERQKIKEERKETESKFLGLKPDLLALCTVSEKEQNQLSASKKATETANDLDLEGLDDEEISGYILTETEAVLKDKLWNKMNAEYLKAAKEREERAAKEREEGKPEKKKRKPRKKPIGPSSSAGEAIEKMLQEKKISSKINYDILKSLTAPVEEAKPEDAIELLLRESQAQIANQVLPKVETASTSSSSSMPSTSRKSYVNLSNNRRSKPQMGLPIVMQGEDDKPDEKPVEQVEDVAGMFLYRHFIRNFLKNE